MNKKERDSIITDTGGGLIGAEDITGMGDGIKHDGYDGI